MTMRLVLVMVLIVFGSTASAFASEATIKIVTASDIQWTQLNPARGDKSPKAANLWGDRIGPGPAGFLLGPVDGFRSPPHIHNVAYRGVVIHGLLHNDDPDAVDMWMPTGSFWTQPAGEVHVTAAKGKTILAYIEVEDGFGVFPPKDAFDSGEKPVNVDRSNLVWLDSSSSTWIDGAAKGPKVTFLWGTPQEGQLNGSLIKLPPDFRGAIKSQGENFRVVIIQGAAHYQVSKAEVKSLEPGSYFSSTGGAAVHRVSSKASEETILYVRTNGPYDIVLDRR